MSQASGAVQSLGHEPLHCSSTALSGHVHLSRINCLPLVLIIRMCSCVENNPRCIEPFFNSHSRNRFWGKYLSLPLTFKARLLLFTTFGSRLSSWILSTNDLEQKPKRTSTRVRTMFNTHPHVYEGTRTVRAVLVSFFLLECRQIFNWLSRFCWCHQYFLMAKVLVGERAKTIHFNPSHFNRLLIKSLVSRIFTWFQHLSNFCW